MEFVPFIVGLGVAQIAAYTLAIVSAMREYDKNKRSRAPSVPDTPAGYQT